jgi:hypothetical protein
VIFTLAINVLSFFFKLTEIFSMKHLFALLVATLILVFGYASSAMADSSRGNWNFGFQNDSHEDTYAATASDSGAVFGKYCFTDGNFCTWLLATPTACEPKATYPALINSDLGSNSIQVTCGTKIHNLYQYIISDSEFLDEPVAKGSRIGIVVPLQGDQFKVYRFDLSGSEQALEEMRALFNSARKGPRGAASRKRTGDQVL